MSFLDAQRSLYGARQALVDLEVAGWANRVRPYSLLGGGGQVRRQSGEVR